VCVAACRENETNYIHLRLIPLVSLHIIGPRLCFDYYHVVLGINFAISQLIRNNDTPAGYCPHNHLPGTIFNNRRWVRKEGGEGRDVIWGGEARGGAFAPT